MGETRTPEIAAILGIPVNAKTVEYADMLHDNARDDKRLVASLKKAESESRKVTILALHFRPC